MGSLGMPASANINPERRFPSMFEPVHGSAPDIAGKGIANPLATIWAGAMMLEFLGEAGAARRLRAAVEKVTADGRVLTPTWAVRPRQRTSRQQSAQPSSFPGRAALDSRWALWYTEQA